MIDLGTAKGIATIAAPLSKIVLETFLVPKFKEFRQQWKRDQNIIDYAFEDKFLDYLIDIYEKILKYSINIIEAFNDIRNNKSFAHDNPVLNYHESALILNNISSTIKFIEFIETQIKKANEPEKVQEAWDDLPF